MSKNKRGLSIVVSYVLLIVLAMSVAVWVYQWLKGSVDLVSAPECPEDVILQVTVRDYSSPWLNLTIKNKGLFNVDGFSVRVNNNSGINLGLYVLNSSGTQINVTQELNMDLNSTKYYSESGLQGYLSGSLNVVEVQPFVNQNGKPVFCKNVATELIS